MRKLTSLQMAAYVRERVGEYDNQSQAAKAFGVSRSYLLRVMSNGRYGRKILRKLRAIEHFRVYYTIEEE